MIHRPALRSLFAAALLALSAGAAFAADGGAAPASPYEEKPLLASDGTLYTVRAGNASDLGLVGGNISSTDKVVSWSLRRQDGSVGQGVIPDTAGQSVKGDIQLAYDEPSASLVALWKEDFTVLNVLRLGIFKNGVWTLANLLPNLGFAHAYNPQMLLSHQTVTTQDSDGNPTSRTRTILSVLWWEQAQYLQARYAPIFLDEVSDASDVTVYDLPAMIGSVGATSDGNYPASSYMYPALQIEGISGGILATFADLSSGKQYVIRINFPDNLGKPGPTNVTWQRRRIPVVGVADGTIPIPTDGLAEVSSVSTIVGPAYRPTIIWSARGAIGFSRFDGKTWSAARTIPLDNSMTYDRALRLVQEMATRN